MSDTVNLTIKITPELKEQIKALAIENQTSMSYEITQRVEASLNGSAVADSHDQDSVEALNATELKQIRSLLKKQKPKKKK